MSRLVRPFSKLDGDPWLGVNYLSRTGGPFMWRSYDHDVVRQELQVLRDHGVRLTRSFMFWPDFQPEPDVIDGRFVDRYRSFLTASEEIGVPTIPTFLVGHMSCENWDVPWRGGRDLYADGFMLGQQAFYISEMVRRIGESPAIAAWLITNEFPIYAGYGPSEYVKAWATVCVQAVRAAGSTLPVSLGDGAWTLEVTGKDNGFLLRDQLGLVDFVGPHSYPMDDDQVRVHFEAAVSCELAQVGKPVVLEEFGVSSTLSSDRNATHFYRQVLHNSLLSGATGWLGWNNTDFDLRDTDPYRHHAFELGFGLTRTDGTAKPQLNELTSFGAILDAVDLPGCGRADSSVAIMVPSHIDRHPRVPPLERSAIRPITTHAYIAAKVADLAPAIIREPFEGTPPPLVLIPSNKLLMSSTFDTIERWARAGSHVYLSWFSGASISHRGSWWPPVGSLFGVDHQLRFGMMDEIDDLVTWEVVDGFGDLSAGDTLTFPFAGPPDARAMLPLEESDAADVLARDAQGRPALVRRRIGAGAVYLATYPVEFFGSARPHAHTHDEVHRLYRALALDAGVRPDVSVADPRVYVDGLVHADGRRFTWIVNLSGDQITTKCDVHGSYRLVDVLTGQDVTDSAELGPFGVVVALHVETQSSGGTP